MYNKHCKEGFLARMRNDALSSSASAIPKEESPCLAERVGHEKSGELCPKSENEKSGEPLPDSGALKMRDGIAVPHFLKCGRGIEW